MSGVSTQAYLQILEGECARFGRLTFPTYAPLLENVRPPLTACGLFVDGTPVGLCMARNESGAAKLLSLYVVPALRRMGWATKLLDCMAVAAPETTDTFWTEYASTLPERSAFEAALRRAGWQEPAVREVRISGLIGPAAAAMKRWPGFDDERDRRTGIAFDQWSPGSVDEPAMDELTREPQFLSPLHPSRYVGRIEPSISIAIRRQGRLIGWILGERLTSRSTCRGPEIALKWPSAYVTQSLWHSGVLVRAFNQSLSQACEIFGEQATGIFYAANPRLAVMAKRRCGSLVSSIDIMQMIKIAR